MGLAVLVALLAGLMPAWRGAAADPLDALRGGRGGGTGRRAPPAARRAGGGRGGALAGAADRRGAGAARLRAGCWSRSRDSTRAASSRFRRRSRPTAIPTPPRCGATSSRRSRRSAQVPGVEEAAAISFIPYDHWGWNFNIRYEGQPNDDPSRLPLVENRIVTPEFFRVTGQRLIEGRMLEAGRRRPSRRPAGGGGEPGAGPAGLSRGPPRWAGATTWTTPPSPPLSGW